MRAVEGDFGVLMFNFSRCGKGSRLRSGAPGFFSIRLLTKNVNPNKLIKLKFGQFWPMVWDFRSWRSSMVERLICNQQVAGSSPIASSRQGYSCQSGEVPEWPKGTGCKPVGVAYGGSNPPLSTIRRPQEAGIAQWPERQPSKLRVAGSSPVSRSKQRAHVAQLVEHILGKDEVHRFDPGRGLHF